MKNSALPLIVRMACALSCALSPLCSTAQAIATPVAPRNPELMQAFPSGVQFVERLPAPALPRPSSDEQPARPAASLFGLMLGSNPQFALASLAAFPALAAPDSSANTSARGSTFLAHLNDACPMSPLLDPDGKTMRVVCLANAAFFPDSVRMGYELHGASEPPHDSAPASSVAIDVEFADLGAGMSLNYAHACSIDSQGIDDPMLPAFAELAGRNGSIASADPAELSLAIEAAKTACPELALEAESATEVRWQAWIELTPIAKVSHVNAKGWRKDGRLSLIGWSQTLSGSARSH